MGSVAKVKILELISILNASTLAPNYSRLLVCYFFILAKVIFVEAILSRFKRDWDGEELRGTLNSSVFKYQIWILCPYNTVSLLRTENRNHKLGFPRNKCTCVLGSKNI